MSGRVETVVAHDDGRFYEVQVRVLRSWTALIDCSCWKHREPHAIEVIETAAGIYFRPAQSNVHFRESGHAGPLAVFVTDWKMEN